MSLTTDRNDPGLKAVRPDGQQEAYLILSPEERAKGFVRPVRTKYEHVGPPKPEFPLRDLTEKEAIEYAGLGYLKFEEYPADRAPVIGRFFTKADLDRIAKGGCGTLTTMALPLAETYARNPSFYGATYCAGCHTHFPVGPEGEFVWDRTTERVGT